MLKNVEKWLDLQIEKNVFIFYSEAAKQRQNYTYMTTFNK